MKWNTQGALNFENSFKSNTSALLRDIETRSRTLMSRGESGTPTSLISRGYSWVSVYLDYNALLALYM